MLNEVYVSRKLKEVEHACMHAKSQAERSNSHNQQTQKKSSGSVQVNASDEAEVHVHACMQNFG